MLVGASMAEDILDAYKVRLVGNDIMRVFPNGPNTEKVIGGSTCKVPPAWTDPRLAYCQANGVIPFISSKGNGTDAFVAYMRDWLINAPSWVQTVYYADWHEPEKDYGNGSSAGRTEYKAHQTKLWNMIKALPAATRAKVKFGIILTTQWTEDPNKGNFNYNLYDPSTPTEIVGDFIGYDAYVLSNIGGDVVKPSTLPTPTNFLQYVKEYTYTGGPTDTRMRIFPELGLIGMPDDLDGTVRAGWLQGIYNIVKTWKVGVSGWTKPWSFGALVWWNTTGKATGEVPRIGQRRDFPLHLRTVDSTKAVTLPNQAGHTQPAPVVTFNAIWTAERTTAPPPDPDPDPVDPDPIDPYPGTAAKYLIGATMKKADIPVYKARLAGNQMFRIYPNSDGLPPAWTDVRFVYAQEVGAIPFVSSNIDGNASLFPAMVTWLSQMPSWVPYIYLTDRHEPENETFSRETYLANFRAWWEQVILQLPAAVRARVKAGPALARQWIEDPRETKGHGDYTLYDPMPQLGIKTDIFATSHYMDSWKPGSTANASLVADAYKDPVAFLAPFKAYKAPTVGGVVDDRDRVFAEFGAIGIPNDPTGEKRAAWITGCFAELDTWTKAAQGWRFGGLAWWQNQGTSGPSLTPIGTLRFFNLDLWQQDSTGSKVLPGNPPAPLAAYNQGVLAHAAAPDPDPPPGGGTLSAGVDATIPTTATFTRTATEPSGATITARKWEIVSGPMGTGTQIGSAAALSWKPGSSVAGSNDIRQPTFQELAYRLTSVAENSTLDWTTAYGYIEDIGDNRGYTAGLVGFTSGTGDMLQVVQQYAIEKPGNALAAYITKLQECAAIGFGTGASAAAASKLGPPFIAAWKSAAANDVVFRKVQRDFRKSMYWDDALVQALADGVGPLGLAIYYDVLVNHGVGDDSESFGGILAFVRAANTKPSSGGNQTTWLNAVTDRRNTILVGWGDTQQQVDGRVFMHRLLINGGTVDGAAQAANLNLVAPFKVSCYGDVYTIAARPEPVADSVLGTYVLRYTATGAGTDTAELTVSDNTATDPGTPGGGGGGGSTNPIPDVPELPDSAISDVNLLAASYTILVTDSQLNIQGDPIHEWSYLQVTLRWKEPGSGQFKVPAYPYIRNQLKPGCRIVVLRRVLGVTQILIAGPMEQRLRERSDDGENGGVGQLTVTFADDTAWLAVRLAYPDPSKTIETQTTDFWTYSGNPELGMLQLVAGQAGPSALPARQIPRLVTAGFSGISGTGTVALGPTTDVNPRERLEFLTDVLRKMAQLGVGMGYDPDSLGFRTRQTQINGQNVILFEVLRSRNLSGQVHFSFGMGNLKFYSFQEDAPTLTHPHVGGQYNKGDANAGADKFVKIYPTTDANSLNWGRYEGYLPRPGTDTDADKRADAVRDLEEKKASGRLAVSAADTVDCRAGIHYGVGDIVSVELDVGEYVIAPVQTIAMQAYPTSGEVVGTTIGDQSARYESAWIRQQRFLDMRLGVLEKRTNFGLNGPTT